MVLQEDLLCVSLSLTAPVSVSLPYVRFYIRIESTRSLNLVKMEWKGHARVGCHVLNEVAEAAVAAAAIHEMMLHSWSDLK